MSSDLNLCQFIGRLGKDVDLKYSPSGEAIASFSLAVGSTWKDKATGDKKESTEWISVTAFGNLAQICGDYLAKGSRVYVSGRWKTDKYTTKDGVEKYATKLIADKMQMLDTRGKAEQAAPAEQKQGDSMDHDDDIPF